MRVLLVTSRFPLPAWRGNQVRTVEWLEALRGHDLGLACPEPPDRTSGELPAEVSHYSLGAISRCTGLLRAAVSGLPLQEGLYDSGTAQRVLSATLRSWRPDVVVMQILVHFLRCLMVKPT